MMGGGRLTRTRSAFSAALLAGALFAAPASAQTLDLSDLPPEARLPGMKLNFQASLQEPTCFDACRPTSSASTPGI